MDRIRASSWASVVGFALIPGFVDAETIRCGNDLIVEGTPTAIIRDKCGEPTSIDSTSQPVYARHADGTTYQVGVETVDFWFYDFGSRRIPVRMTVRDGIAEKIELVSGAR